MGHAWLVETCTQLWGHQEILHLPLALLPAMPEQVNLAQKCHTGVRDRKGYSQAVLVGLEFAANAVVSNKGHQS